MLVAACEYFGSAIVAEVAAAELDFVVLFFELAALDLALRAFEAEAEVEAFAEVDFCLL